MQTSEQALGPASGIELNLDCQSTALPHLGDS